MILNRLYELALRENLLSETAWEDQPVPYVIVLGEGGEWLPPVREVRNEVVTVKTIKKKGVAVEQVKRELDKGTLTKVPRPHGDAAQRGFARFFVDTLPRVLPVEVEEKDREKFERSRATFWTQIDEAAVATGDPALAAVRAFGQRLNDAEFAARVRAAVAERKPDAGARVTFAYFPDGGRTILERPTLRAWYAGYFAQFTATKQTGGRVGFCTITGEVGPLPTVHPVKLSGVPGGLPTGVSLVSFDKPAFQHYGLDGAANAAIGYAAADGYARGFQWLRARKDHYFVVGGTLFLYWTRVEVEGDAMEVLTDAKEVERVLSQPAGGVEKVALDETEFYLLAISGNSARAVVRDYLETTLGRVRDAVRAWFTDLRVADPSKEHQGRPNAAFPLWQLAAATARASDEVGTETHALLLRAALSRGPVPDSILAACLSRLRVEGGEGFRAARLGLVKLCLNRSHRRENPMSETLDPNERHPAYVYGRLLRTFEEIQYSALGQVNASVVDKFYGTFSAAPALVFARLFVNAQNHLRKLRSEKEGAAISLDRRLQEVTRLLPAAPPSGTLSLADQGRFALGYYHQKSQSAAEFAERRRLKEEKAAK